MSFPKLNAAAPDFSLPDQNGNTVKLKDFRGKKTVVLYFYPKAMTPGCTVQACSVTASAKAFEKLDAVVLGVSTDSPTRLKKFEEKEKLRLTLLSDEDHAIADKYGTWAKKKLYGREYMGLLRSTFIIGKDGKLKHILEKANTKTHHDDVLHWLKENLD